LTTIEKATH